MDYNQLRNPGPFGLRPVGSGRINLAAVAEGRMMAEAIRQETARPQSSTDRK